MRPVLVSACLLGINCRYDGSDNLDPQVIVLLEKSDFLPVPVCPEQLAGLPTPRPKAWFNRGDGRDLPGGNAELVDESGQVVNDIFVRGAQETLKVAHRCGCRTAILKQRSPSCGSNQIHCNGDLVEGVGVTCALLRRSGILVVGEDSLEKL